MRGWIAIIIVIFTIAAVVASVHYGLINKEQMPNVTFIAGILIGMLLIVILYEWGIISVMSGILAFVIIWVASSYLIQFICGIPFTLPSF